MKTWELRRTVAAFFYPNRCPFCGGLIGMRDFWCPGCIGRLSLLEDIRDIPGGLDGFSAVCRYSGAARTAILRMKRGCFRSPIEAIAVLMAENAAELIGCADVITAIPSSRKRRRELGYAQSEEIAKLISRMSGKPFRRFLAVNPGKSEQKRLTAEERRENAYQAFRIIPGTDIGGARVLLIDDVCATGSTLSAAAELLKGSGASEVYGAVFAKSVRR